MTMHLSHPFVILLLSLVWIGTDGNNNNQMSSSSAIRSATPFKDDDCELLQSAKLVYEQHLAPRAISDVLRVVVEKINREIEGVQNVQITWDGSTLRQQQNGVGLHHVQTLVERSTTSQQQCFIVPMEIQDTDECTLPPSHEWYHKCHSSAVCINTIGGYECLCPLLNPQHQSILIEKFQANMKSNSIGTTQQQEWDDSISHPFGNRSLWEVNLPISSDSKITTAVNKCHGEASTKFCCDSDAHSVQGRICRSTFICPMDPCNSTSSPSPCDAKLATCTRSIHPWDTPNFSCTCPEGYIGNGHACPSTTLTDEDPYSYYLCGCKPIQVDLCAHVSCKEYKHQECVVVKNKPTCVCKKGYTKHHPPKGDCVPEHLPTLRLKCCNPNLVEDCATTNNNNPTVYYQGDYYQECGVDIINTNSDVEQDYRSLIIDYSNLHRAGTTTQCFTQVGNYSVTYKYQLATPDDHTTSNNDIISITRTVQVQDVDECAAVGKTDILPNIRVGGGGCPAVFVAHCDFSAGATCVNTIGSYTCKCPAYTVGDGFQKITDYDIADNGSTGSFFKPPTGYQGGTGCVDTTKPIIQLLGPNPKLFRIAKIEPLAVAAAVNVKMEHDPLLYNNIVDAQRLIRSTYGSQIQSIIDATNGAELCRTEESSQNSKCVYAFDKTYNDTFDLSSKVVIGNLIRIDEDDETNFHWKVPYNVMDAAGNEADTVYRDIIVEEVELMSLIEKQEQDERDRERLAAADVEIIKMKKEVKNLSDKLAASQKQQQHQQKKQCPKCEPPTKVTSSNSCDCQKICTTIRKNNDKLNSDTSCIPPPDTPILSNSMIPTMIQFLQNGLTSSVNQIPAFVGAVMFSLGVCVLLFLRSVWIFVAGKRANRRNRWNKVLEQKELALLENSVTYYKSPPIRPEAVNWSTAPSDGSVLSPPPRATRLFSSDAAATITSPPLITNPDDIFYASLSPITPSRNKSDGI